MNENTRKWYGLAAALVIIFVAAAWYFASHRAALAPSSPASATSTDSGTATTAGLNQDGTVQVGVVPNTSNIPTPDITRPYTPLSTLPQSIKDSNKKLYEAAVQQLKINPNGIAYWLQLAILRKGANDFSGAEEVWLYVTKRWQTDPIAYNNLADLYANYLHDYAKATTYWNALIKLSPTNISAYINLATMQNIHMKDKVAARATLEAGLAANKDNPDLQNALNNL